MLSAVEADRLFEGEKFINYFSVYTREPEDGQDHHQIPDTRRADYDFPIEHISRTQDVAGAIRLEGTLYLQGDASEVALPLLNQFFTRVDETARSGSRYKVKIHFDLARPGTLDAVEISWLSLTEIEAFNARPDSDGNTGDSRFVVGFTQLGSRQIKINPIYADRQSMKAAFVNTPINPRQLRDIIKHTRGVFAHELAHAMGLSHMRNRTKSIVSYAYGRRVTAGDAQAICMLVTHGNKNLCPD